MSSKEENPNTEDVIATLAAYLKRNPRIAIPACQTAKLSFQKGKLSATKCSLQPANCFMDRCK